MHINKCKIHKHIQGEGGQVGGWMIPSDLHPYLGSNERVWAMQPLCRNMGSSQEGAYSFGKMNSPKCKLNFMILQANLATDSTNFIGIMNQVHCIDKQPNLKFQPIHYML